MKNRLMYIIGLLAIGATTSLMISVAQEITDAALSNTPTNDIILNHTGLNDTILNDTILNNTTFNKTIQNISIVNNAILNATNETHFTIGTGIKPNNSTFDIGKPIKPMKDASKMGYIIQGTPHGYV